MKPQKPITLRIIFILNALMTILPFGFYYVITTKNIDVGGLDPMWMIYTALGYMVSFVLLVTTILKQNLVLFRVVIVLNVLISLPAKAFIGIAVAIISFALSFNGKVKTYFRT